MTDTPALDDIDQELLQNETEETILPEDEHNVATAFFASSSGLSRYPSDGVDFMLKNGPIDPQLVVPDADLIILERRDARFYYVYRLQNPHPHPKLNTAVPDASKYIKETWVYIVDTSPEHQKQRFDFEETLSVPIGPDSLMDEIGEYAPQLIRLMLTAQYVGAMTLPPGTALYASTPTTHHDRYQDVLNICLLDGYIFAYTYKYNV